MEGLVIVFLIVIAAIAFDRFVSYSGDGYEPYDPEAARKRKKRR